MNKLEKQRRTNECLKLLDNSFRHDFNSIRLNTHNTLTHEIAKTIKAYQLIKEGKQILTEAIFKNKARADILVMEDFKVIEIMETETREEVLNKKNYYPKELELTYLFAKDIINESLTYENE